MLITDLPLKDLDEQSPGIKHFIDVVVDIPAGSIDIPTWKAIVKESAWDELTGVMKFKVRPVFDTVSQYVLLPQSDDKLSLFKRVYYTADKVPARHIANFLCGSGKDIAWGNQSKKFARKAFQWMLEQVGRNSDSIH